MDTMVEVIGPKAKDRVGVMGPKAKDRVGVMGPKAKDRVGVMGPKAKDRVGVMGPKAKDRVGDECTRIDQVERSADTQRRLEDRVGAANPFFRSV
jgi:hypothetical protein